MILKKHRRLFTVFAVVLLFLSACGMPQEVLDRAKEVEQAIQQTKQLVSDEKAKFEGFSNTEDFAPFVVYSQREKWVNAFGDAMTMVNALERQCNNELVPLVKENKSDSQSQVSGIINKYLREIGKIKKEIKKPFDRMAYLRRAMQESPQWIATAESEQKHMESIINELNAKVSASKKSWSEKTETIDEYYAPILALATTSAALLSEGQTQLAKGTDADYAVIADNTVKITDNLKELQKYQESFPKTLQELDTSYVKVLTDQTTRYFVQIGRTSWDENSDWNTDHDYTYPQLREVNEKGYNYFESLDAQNAVIYGYPAGNGLFGKYGGSFIGDTWNQLKVNVKEGWPSGAHNYAEFWVADTVEKYYHKYTIIQGDEVKETGWVEVSEAVFDEYYDELGQEIVSKPYGYFEDERLEDTAPAGMSFVGNSAYGEWKKDETGTSYWAFYGRYAFYRDLFWGPSWRGYYYDDWDYYNRNYRNNGNYYGKDPLKPRYGTAGSWTNTNPALKKSKFAKMRGWKNAKSDFIKAQKAAGNTKSAPGSVRGAGPASRNKGPGKGK